MKCPFWSAYLDFLLKILKNKLKNIIKSINNIKKYNKTHK